MNQEYSERKCRRLGVIPGDSLEAYERKGTSIWLKDYYNPRGFFDEVFLLSPLEREFGFKYGMVVIPTKPRQLKDRIRELKIDVIRAYGGHWPCDIACRHKVRGVPVIVSVHDTNPRLLHRSIRRSDFAFCVSKAVKNLVLKELRDEERVWILPNRVDFNRMKRRDSLSRDNLDRTYSGKYHILHVGRRRKQKNLDTLVRSMKILGDDYVLLAIGQGDTTPYLNIARECGVADRFFCLDSVSNECLSLYYSWADCFCTPSRWEGFGLVFIEALACEAVVVTSNIEPMNEYIHHGYNGLLVDNYEDPASIANAIATACTDQRLRERLSKNARSSVERFRKEVIDCTESEYYRRVLKEYMG